MVLSALFNRCKEFHRTPTSWKKAMMVLMYKKDLANAFGSIPHQHIFSTLEEFGMPRVFLQLLQELYDGSTTTIHLTEGETAEIPIRSGVKQGCPLSPIIFNLAMEPLIRSISNSPRGFELHGERVNILAYTDNLVLIMDDPESL
ncbi:uncharacterized protein [Emydura macquarii macquarii]|uniref:uncharacterized protein n=1 Tax=Emydura macquarii macquarii TaxID=1129001 RepID=UPI00352BD184